MYYAVIPEALASPIDVELVGGECATNSSAFRFPVIYMQRRLERLKGQSLSVYNSLPEALAAGPKSAEYAFAVLCLSVEDLNKSFDWLKPESLIALKPGVKAPMFSSLRFLAQNKADTETKSLQIVIQDDCARLYHEFSLISVLAKSSEPAEEGLMHACQALDIAQIILEINNIIKDKTALSSAPLRHLFDMPNSQELRTAITLIMIHGQHECIYKDEVYESLYEGISCPELKMFFHDMRELIVRGGFEASAYHLFFQSARDGDFDFCDELIKTEFAVYVSDKVDSDKVRGIDAAIEAELRTACTFLNLVWGTDGLTVCSTGESTSTEGERFIVSPVSAGDGSSERSIISDTPYI